MRGHSPVPIVNFNGNFRRGDADMAPRDHLADSQNVVFGTRSVGTRNGIQREILYTAFDGATGILRIHRYEREGEGVADRLLILTDDGKIYDSTDTDNAILNIPGMVDFSVLCMAGRAYISPHNRYEGMPGEFLYVYEGTPTDGARKAAGVGPEHSPVISEGASGDISKGDHLFAIAFETPSGFITKMGAPTLYPAPKNKKAIVKLTAPFTIPPGTIKAYILATKELLNEYSGNPEEYEYFFVPEGEIDDPEEDDELEVNFFDSSLVRSADYLLDQMDEIPAVLGMCEYNGSMVIWNADGDNSTVWISRSNEPEAFDAAIGFVSCRPNTGGPVKSCVGYHGSLHIHKSGTTHITIANGNPPSTWIVNDVEDGFGTEVFGGAKVLDKKGQTHDSYLVATVSGLFVYTGTFLHPALSYKISDDWRTLDASKFDQTQLYIDPTRKLIFVSVVGAGSSYPNKLFVGNYEEGMNHESIKWTTWVFPTDVKSIMIHVNDNNIPLLRYASHDSHIYLEDITVAHDVDASGSPIAINSYADLPYCAISYNGEINHFVGMIVRAKGYGTLKLTAYSLDKAKQKALTGIALSAGTGKEIQRLINMSAERLSVRAQCNTADEWFRLDRAVLYAKVSKKARIGVS